MRIRAIRGATTLLTDTTEEMTSAVSELLLAMLDRNKLGYQELISLFFTATPDIHSAFPAMVARTLPLSDVPLMCAVEMDVAGALPMAIRIMAHVESDIPRSEIKHVYLRGATVLRPDIAGQ
jgi:chorismate mutase